MTVLDEILKARAARDIDGILALVPYAQFLGMQLQEDGDHLLSTLPFAPHLVGNPMVPALHGGAIGSLLEFSAILQVLWAYEVTTVPKTINITVDYLRPAKLETTFARATVTKQGRRVVNVAVQAYQSDIARWVATANVHLLVRTERASP